MHVLLFPGQGSQFKGMGGQLWRDYPQLTQMASDLLGYRIDKLCLEDPDNQLRMTLFTQPALFMVQALHYYRWREKGIAADAVMGHSLGEYSALLAAGCFDVETGLRLVQQRGLLMSQARGGSMAAVLGMSADALRTLLDERGLGQLTLANYNSPTQLVLAGETQLIEAAAHCLSAQGIQCVALNVSGAFHSPHMQAAQRQFEIFLQGFDLNDPLIPVIANATALPYPKGQVGALLAQQITSPVLWVDSVRYVMDQGNFTYTALSAVAEKPCTQALGKFVEEIRTTASTPAAHVDYALPPTDAQRLGSQVFRERHGLDYAYVAGGMFRGISSAALVQRMAHAGMLAYLGTAGMPLEAVEAAVLDVLSTLKPGASWGMNLTPDTTYERGEHRLVQLCLKHGVQRIEVSGFNTITEPLVYYRIAGLQRDAAGNIQCQHRILAKVMSLAVAELFMSPPPVYWVNSLLAKGLITPDQALMAESVPLCDDLCVQANPAGPTLGGSLALIFPSMTRLRSAMINRFNYRETITLGAGGGIGSPEAAASAFLLGAEFVLTGSINQCTVESGATDCVKNLLQHAGLHDIAHAPNSEMLNDRPKLQVLHRSSLFAPRANRLLELFNQLDSLEAIAQPVRTKLERDFFNQTLSDIEAQRLNVLKDKSREREIQQVLTNPKVRMKMVLSAYWHHGLDRAASGLPSDLVNAQVHISAAIGAFNNHYNQDAGFNWQSRHIDQVAVMLMTEAARQLRETRVFMP